MNPFSHVRMKSNFILILLFISGTIQSVFGQNDTLITKSGTVIVGEIKSMYKGVLKIKTSYSENDLAIKWEEIKRLSSPNEFIISETDGEIYHGSINGKKDDEINITISEKDSITLSLARIVYLRTVKSDFWSRLSASVALGYNFTKSNNLVSCQVHCVG